jgi:hypothetical protein
MGFNSDLMLKPIVIGGVIGGILSSIPIISCLNCCCLLYMASGVITAHLILQKARVEMNDIAIAGAGSGGIAGFICGVLSIIIGTAGNAAMYSMMGMPDGSMNGMVGGIVGGIIGIPIAIIFGTIFGAIGAIIYMKLKE